MAKAAKVKAGDALFFAADKPERAATLAGLARTRIGRELNLIPDGEYKFCWIVDFPMYEWNEDEKKIDFSHNPFSMPQLTATNSWPWTTTTRTPSWASRPISTTSSATAMNCRPAPSATMIPM